MAAGGISYYVGSGRWIQAASVEAGMNSRPRDLADWLCDVQTIPSPLRQTGSMEVPQTNTDHRVHNPVLVQGFSFSSPERQLRVQQSLVSSDGHQIPVLVVGQ